MQQAMGQGGLEKFDFGISLNFDGAQDDCKMKQSDEEMNESIEGEQDDMEVEDLGKALVEEQAEIEEVENQDAPGHSAFLDADKLMDQDNSLAVGTGLQCPELPPEPPLMDPAQTQQN